MSKETLTIQGFEDALSAGNHYGGSYWSTFFAMADGGIIGMQYALDNRNRIIEEMQLGSEGDRQWQAVAYDVNYEDADMWCEGYNCPIVPAYD